jgi:hypothetical chaperone protein
MPEKPACDNIRMSVHLPARPSEAWIGLDFGTTNSAVSVLGSDGTVRIAAHTFQSTRAETYPSVLYFDKRRDDSGTTRRVSRGGVEAIREYLDASEKGRLMQSLKAFLGDERFDGTEVLGQRMTLEALITVLVRHVLDSAARTVGPLPTRAIAGRPVHFLTPATEESDRLAQDRLLSALRQSGIEEVVFEYEPVAAAYSYSQTLGRDELILIGDFGGGTSDFSVLRVGPSLRSATGTGRQVLATGGIAVAGDAFDRRIIRHAVAPRLGLGGQYISPPDKVLPIPETPYTRLERWHYLSIPDQTTLAALRRLQPTALIPERIEAFVYLLEHRLGFQLYEAVRDAKFRLSQEDSTVFAFDCGPVRMKQTITRAAFERWLEPELALLGATIDRVIHDAAVSPADIDRVFLTGGSSFVPAVRRLFLDRFGAAKIAGGDELTSVAKGLALRAADQAARRGSHRAEP